MAASLHPQIRSHHAFPSISVSSRALDAILTSPALHNKFYLRGSKHFGVISRKISRIAVQTHFSAITPIFSLKSDGDISDKSNSLAFNPLQIFSFNKIIDIILFIFKLPGMIAGFLKGKENLIDKIEEELHEVADGLQNVAKVIDEVADAMDDVEENFKKHANDNKDIADKVKGIKQDVKDVNTAMDKLDKSSERAKARTNTDTSTESKDDSSENTSKRINPQALSAGSAKRTWAVQSRAASFDLIWKWLFRCVAAIAIASVWRPHLLRPLACLLIRAQFFAM